MLEDMRRIVRFLEKNQKTVSTMESCTGGGFANLITNVGGASDVLMNLKLKLVFLKKLLRNIRFIVKR